MHARGVGAIVAALAQPLPLLERRAERIWQRHLLGRGGAPVIGLHMRGDDFYGAPVRPDAYEGIVAAFLAAYPRGQCFVACSDTSFRKDVTGRWLPRFGVSRVVMLETLHTGGVDSHDHCGVPAANLTHLGSGAARAREALVDVLLLAKSDFLLCGLSGIPA